MLLLDLGLLCRNPSRHRCHGLLKAKQHIILDAMSPVFTHMHWLLLPYKFNAHVHIIDQPTPHFSAPWTKIPRSQKGVVFDRKRSFYDTIKASLKTLIPAEDIP